MELLLVSSFINITLLLALLKRQICVGCRRVGLSVISVVRTAVTSRTKLSKIDT